MATTSSAGRATLYNAPSTRAVQTRCAGNCARKRPKRPCAARCRRISPKMLTDVGLCFRFASAAESVGTAEKWLKSELTLLHRAGQASRSEHAHGPDVTWGGTNHHEWLAMVWNVGRQAPEKFLMSPLLFYSTVNNACLHNTVRYVPCLIVSARLLEAFANSFFPTRSFSKMEEKHAQLNSRKIL